MLQRLKNQSSNVIITIKYGGLKATQFFSKYTPQAYKQLLEDLRELGFPFPKKSNIVFLSHGTLEFFWPMALHEKSHFVANLVSRVTLPTPGPFKNEQIAMRRQLSIFSLTVREDQHYDPCSLPQIPGSQISQILPPRVAPPNKQSSQTLKNAVRYHPYSRLQPSATPHSTEGHQVVQVKPVSGPVRAAETFLDEVGTALGVMGQLKSEPVEPMITQFVQQVSPPYPQSQNASQWSTEVKQEQSPKFPLLSGASASTDVSHIAASSPTSPSGIAPFNSKPPVKDYSQTVPSIPNVVPPQVRNIGRNETNSAAPSEPYRANKIYPYPHPTSAVGGPIRSTQSFSMVVTLPNQPPSAMAGPATLGLQHPRKSDAITTPKFSASLSHHSLDPLASRGTTQQRPAQAGDSNPSPAISPPSLAQAKPLPNIQQLSTDQLIQMLHAFREKVIPVIERQKQIVDELDKRKAVSVPSKFSLLSSEDIEKQTAKLRGAVMVFHTEREKHAESMLAMGKVLDEERAKRTEVESVLETERAKRVEAESILEIEHAKRVEMENVLAAERTKRTEMENVLKDIERERKNPFIVPGLLEAFIQISQATTAAINHQASTKMDV